MTPSPFTQDCARVWTLLTGGRARRVFDCARTPGLHALAAYRLTQWLSSQPRVIRWPGELVYQYMQHRAKVKWGISLSRSAHIGPGLYIGHFGGIIVGSVTLGRDCNISQGVTLGIAGQGARRGCPTIGDHVYIGPGAKVFGRITIGSHVRIGANAVVHKDVPDHTVVAAPGFIILREGTP